MLRLSLIIAIVAGLAAAGLNFYRVRDVMVTTMNDLESTKQTLASTQADLSKTKGTLKKAEEERDSTKAKLTKSQSELKERTAQLAAKEQEATELSETLIKTKADRDAAQQLVEQWRQMNMTPEKAKKLIADLDRTRESLGVAEDEKKLLAKKASELQAKLDDLVDPEKKVVLPAGLKGRVIAVDPKFDFVVIDVGQNAGVLERGELLVNRNGKLVGKIRVAAVQSSQSIANVLPQWKSTELEIMEGDQVLY